MTAERLVWLIVGIVLVVWAAIVFFSDGLNITQETHDGIQDLVLAAIAFGLAFRR